MIQILIIPTFLKLIFPFKWIQSCITVLPKEKLNFLEAPGSFIFGVLSDLISLNDLMNEYPGKIIVDCDTNEIFGDSYLEPYEPPIEVNPKEEKNKKENEYKIHLSNRLTQGNNLINIGGSYLYKYEPDSNTKKIKLSFKESNNIIIDTKKSQFLMDKTNSFIDSNEWKWLRKNIQLIRNPEIFELENISHKKYSLNKIYLNDEEDDENIILQNRSFSYNIQNIFMTYILNKLNYSESEFMSIFKHTNLYLSYNDKKKFQNDSGRIIVENILDLKNKKQERNIDNSFIIEYTLQNFKSQIIIEKLDSKLENKTKLNDSEEKIYNQLKLIFNNYNQVKNEDESNNFEDIYNKESISGGRKSEMKKQNGRLTKSFIRTHERNKTSILRETNSSGYNFILSSADRPLKEVFKFYGSDGFLNFINNFEKFINDEKIDIKYELYEEKINEQILDIILNSEDIFNQNIPFSETNNLVNTLEKVDALTKKDIKNSLISIPENTKEEEEDKENNNNKLGLYYGRSNVLQKSQGEEYIISSSLKSPDGDILNSALNEIVSDMELNKFLYSENIINFFPNFSEHNEHKSINNNDESINHKCQYFLFIAFILQNIFKDKIKSDEFIEKIKLMKKIKEIDMKYLISKLYIISYKFSGIKRRDFPFFSFYNFLLNIDLDELILLRENFINETDLNEIYENIVNEKKIIREKKLQKNLRKEKLEEEKKLKELKVKEETENEQRIRINSSKIKNKTNKIQDLFKIFETKLFDKKTDKMEHKPNFISSNYEFNLFLSYPINRGSQFESENKYIGFNYLIKNFAEEMLSVLPKNNEYNKDNQHIITEINKKLLENTKIFELISQLKYIYPEKLVQCKERICFWANCFNFLLIFTIFYKKWNINGQDDWKYFFQNVKYLIGDKYYTFNDMQYLLFKRPLFFPSSYKNNDEIKKYRADKTEDAKITEKKYPLIFNHFLIYLPIKDFIKPIIFEENNLEFQLNERMKQYLSNFIIVDKEKNITIPEILNNYQPRFICKDYKKFQCFLNESFYNLIKEKKYKGNTVNHYEWTINFDSLLD